MDLFGCAAFCFWRRHRPSGVHPSSTSAVYCHQLARRQDDNGLDHLFSLAAPMSLSFMIDSAAIRVTGFFLGNALTGGGIRLNLGRRVVLWIEASTDRNQGSEAISAFGLIARYSLCRSIVRKLRFKRHTLRMYGATSNRKEI